MKDPKRKLPPMVGVVLPISSKITPAVKKIAAIQGIEPELLVYSNLVRMRDDFAGMLALYEGSTSRWEQLDENNKSYSPKRCNVESGDVVKEKRALLRRKLRLCRAELATFLEKHHGEVNHRGKSVLTAMDRAIEKAKKTGHLQSHRNVSPARIQVAWALDALWHRDKRAPTYADIQAALSKHGVSITFGMVKKQISVLNATSRVKSMKGERRQPL